VKKLFAIILCLCMLSCMITFTEAASTREYEMWTQSPSITCGLTSDDVMIYKAMLQDKLLLYRLSSVGSNYYLAICCDKTTEGGNSGSTNTVDYYFYTLYTTGTEFIILSKETTTNEYYWDRGFSFANIASKVDSAYYKNNNSEVPYYIVNPKGKYTNSNYTEFDEYFFITSTGKMYKYYASAEDGAEGYPYIKDQILYKGQNRYKKSSSSYTYYYMSDGTTKASNSTPIYFKNGSMTYGTAVKVPVADMTSDNGYAMYTEGFSSNVSGLSSSSIKTYLGDPPTNVFPDGRYVEVDWRGMGGDLYELWYSIYNADGTLRATGPTGYSTKFSSAINAYDLIAWAINDSKFVACVDILTNGFLKEYYRISVVSENDSGEVISKAEMGEKNINPPVDSDTEVVQSVIDFASEELPLGYNIKDNVIDSGKLDAILRDQINNVRLNDIVILAKEGYQSGEQNTGVTLETYSAYNYTFGSSYIRLYTNGQYFRWYCDNPENLTPGTYSKAFSIGDKTIYVTFKIIQPPTNDGATTVVF